MESNKVEIWADIFGSGYEYLDWIYSIRFADGADWDRIGNVTISFENPDEDGIETVTYTPEDVFEAYETALACNYTHCGGCTLEDEADVCTTDIILQTLTYGELVFG